MESSLSELGLYLLAAVVAGSAFGWLIRSALANSRTRQLEEEWQSRFDDANRQRDRLKNEASTLRTSIEAQEAVIHQRDLAVKRIGIELESAREKDKMMSKNIFTLRAEREDFKAKVISFQNALTMLKRQSVDMQTEFLKSRDFYKSELAKAFEKRRALEDKLENSREEYQSFSNLLNASRSEHAAVNTMLAAAKKRLSNLDILEQSVISLEAENAQLKHDNAVLRQNNDALNRDVFEQEELRIQNKELTRVLKSMEDSRKQYENDALRYRQHADKSEQKSETLRLRLDEVEKNFMEMEKQQRTAISDARNAAAHSTNGKKPAEKERDNLQEIVGIGKVFENTLHELGIYSFRQLANFGVSDISPVNAELREFRGRMEQDDWIGQAKDLLYKKYGNA